MAYKVFNATKDLSTGPMAATTAFGADAKLGIVGLIAAASTIQGGPGENPASDVLQESIKIIMKHPSNPLYDQILHTGNFNGKRFYTWAPVGNWAIPSGYNILVEVTDQYSVGIVYLVVTAE